eukprot:11391405-Alexandrium_andersonii.AAC.1
MVFEVLRRAIVVLWGGSCERLAAVSARAATLLPADCSDPERCLESWRFHGPWAGRAVHRSLPPRLLRE